MKKVADSPADSLHALIHSLTAPERRYFKLQALPGGGGPASNYMRLYEALLAQPTYDEAALRQQFQGEPLLRHLSAEKNYLYRQVLRSLRAMQQDSDHRARLRACIDDATILFERGLYAQCRKLLRRATTLASETENHIALLEITVLERRLWKILSERDRAAIAEQLIHTQNELLDKLRRTFAYYNLYDRMYLHTHQKFHLRSAAPDPALAAILADPLLHDPDHADSFEARHFYWLCQGWRHQLSGDHQQLHDSLAALIAWWEAHPAMVASDPARYVVTLSNYLHAAGLLGRYAVFPNTFAKIRKAQPSHQHGDTQVLQTLHYYELLYALNQADWPGALAAGREAADFLAHAGDGVAKGRRLAFYYNLVILHFIHEDWRTALHWVNAIIDASGTEIREDIQHFARILLVLLHFELGNWDILEYLHRSGYRYLFARKQLHTYERRLMEAVRQLMAHPATQRPILESLQADIALLGSGTEPGIQELRSWIQARLDSRPLREVMAAMLAAPV